MKREKYKIPNIISSRFRRSLPLDIDLGHVDLRLVICFLYIFLLNDVFASGTQGKQPYRAPIFDSKSSIPRSKLEAVAQDAEIPCTSEDYKTENMGCGIDWQAIGLACFKHVWKKSGWFEAKKKCKDEGAYLAKFDYEQHILFFGQIYKNPNVWVGMEADQPTADKKRFHWLDKTVPVFEHWGQGQPSAKQGLDEKYIALHNWGFFDYEAKSLHWVLCRNDTISSDYANKYIKEGWKTKGISEDEQEFVFGTKVNIRCEGYYHRGEAPFIKIESRNGNTESVRIFVDQYPTAILYKDRMRILMKSTISEQMNGLVSSRNNANSIYIKHEGLCIRKSLPYVEFLVDELLAEKRFTCCKLFDDSKTECSSDSVDTPKVKYLARKPTLSIHPSRKGNALYIGEEAACRCLAGTGLETVVSAAVINHTDCGNWTVSLDGTRQKQDKHAVLKDCGIQVKNINTTGLMFIHGGKSTTFEVNMRVTRAFHGAVCACYSYNASSRAEKGTLIEPEDNLQSFSDPIRVFGVPKLKVAYHAEPNIVYRDEILEASCLAFIGDGQAQLVLYAESQSYSFDLNSGSINTTQDLQGVGNVRIQENIVNILCPRGGNLNLDTESCLWVSPHALNWEDARKNCIQRNGDLIDLRNSQTIDFIKRTVDWLKKEGYWIGLSSRKYEGAYSFAWLDESEKAFPSNMSERHCAYTDDAVNWKSDLCNKTYQFICQIPSRVQSTQGIGIPLSSTSATPEEKSALAEFESNGPFFFIELSIKVNDSMDGASLECYTLLNYTGDKLAEKSEFLAVQYGPQPSNMTLSETVINGQKVVKMECSAIVGDEGVLSFGVVHENVIRHLYIINTTAGVTEKKPSPQVTIDTITVSEVKGKGPRIKVTVTMKRTDQLRKASLFCDSRRISMDSTIGEDRLVKAFAFTEASRGGGMSPFLIFLVFVAIVATAVALFLAFMKEGVSHQGEGGVASALSAEMFNEGETGGESHKPSNDEEPEKEQQADALVCCQEED